ncbi:hypothetical protein RZS08_41145, partial [Arthrospira platensis SPKY1]|nr:hypothetical protein [Arthrospira platensis SPKY1]
KFFVIKAALGMQEYFLVFVALLVGLLTLYSMTKIWNEAFWKNNPEKMDAKDLVAGLFSRRNVFMSVSIILLAMVTLTIGFFPEPFFQLADQAAHELMNPSLYIEKVLGGTP